MTPEQISDLAAFRLTTDESDWRNVAARWSDDYWRTFRGHHHGARAADFGAYRVAAMETIRRDGTIVLVCSDKTAPDHWFAWVVFELSPSELAIHYAYSYVFEHGFPRGAGFVRHMLTNHVLPERKPGARLVHSHLTPKWAPIAKTIGSEYHPLRFFQEHKGAL
ncbi:MAG TPA: hypothetical protein VNW92_01180 [Polyangiaceae bacterium]|nr:hypothetical protein [Polyangiaceae bacterium]